MKRIFTVLAITALMVATLAVPAFAIEGVDTPPRCERGQLTATFTPGEKPLNIRSKNFINFIECHVGLPPGTIK